MIKNWICWVRWCCPSTSKKVSIWRQYHAVIVKCVRVHSCLLYMYSNQGNCSMPRAPGSVLYWATMPSIHTDGSAKQCKYHAVVGRYMTSSLLYISTSSLHTCFVVWSWNDSTKYFCPQIVPNITAGAKLVISRQRWAIIPELPQIF